MSSVPVFDGPLIHTASVIVEKIDAVEFRSISLPQVSKDERKLKVRAKLRQPLVNFPNASKFTERFLHEPRDGDGFSCTNTAERRLSRRPDTFLENLIHRRSAETDLGH